MRLLVSHFQNEEYLLPWWVKHHRELFDHAVLINHRSTDNSVEIIKELAPHWEIIDTELEIFDPGVTDWEVQAQEKRFKANLKVALNTTEFLVCPSMPELEKAISHKRNTQGILRGAYMVDVEPHKIPSYDKPLIEQKFHGFWESSFAFKQMPKEISVANHESRSRVVHNGIMGSYKIGRHKSYLQSKVRIDRGLAALWWYSFSPMNELQMQRKVNTFNQARICLGFSAKEKQPEFPKELLIAQHHYLKRFAKPLALASIAQREKIAIELCRFKERYLQFGKYRKAYFPETIK